MKHTHAWRIALDQRQAGSAIVFSFVAVCDGCSTRSVLKPDIVKMVFRNGGFK